MIVWISSIARNHHNFRTGISQKQVMSDDEDRQAVEQKKRKRIRKRKVESEENREKRVSAKKEKRESEQAQARSSSSSSSSSNNTIPLEAASLVNDRTVYLEGLPFDCDDKAVRKFFGPVKSGTILRCSALFNLI